MEGAGLAMCQDSAAGARNVAVLISTLPEIMSQVFNLAAAGALLRASIVESCERVNARGQIDALYYGQGEISAAAPYHRYYACDHLGSVRAMVDAQGGRTTARMAAWWRKVD